MAYPCPPDRTVTDDAACDMNNDTRWVTDAIRAIEADFNRSADTHLIRMDMPPAWRGWNLYLKDESTHPTGSLKHRLARSLFLYGQCNGWIGPDTAIIEASSGSTAVSEAYFARLLGLRFIAVMPTGTSQQKIERIEFYGGECRLVPAASIHDASRDLAWVVVSAGTGGTAATIGRYLRFRSLAANPTRLCVVDPEHSVFYDFFSGAPDTVTSEHGSRIEGIGRPRVEASFMTTVIDRMLRIPDAASMAALQFLERWLGRRCGGSTGTNLIGAVTLLAEMRRDDTPGSVITLLCDDGARYRDSYYSDDWLAAERLDTTPWLEALDRWWASGEWRPPLQ